MPARPTADTEIMSPSPAIVLAGMHRSGTSLVASILSNLGVSLGDHLLTADRHNRRGYFEDVEILTLNREMLIAATPTDDGGHPDWGWTESERLNLQAFENFRAHAIALTEARNKRNKGARWGWKDPRTTVALDFWDSIVPTARFVFVYRHPWEVADSMQRLAAPVFLKHPGYAWRIWAFYNRRLLEFYRRRPERSLLISSDAAQRDPGKLNALLQARLDLGAVKPQHQVEELLEPDLFRTLEPDDPLIALSLAAHQDCAELLRELDRAADFSGAHLWSRRSARRYIAPAAKLAPRLSIVIPCYNQGDYLIDAVASVQRSVTEPCEVIIVNDGSTDPHTLTVLAILRQKGYPVVDQGNKGLASARNAGIEKARGAYILPLDADNRLRSRFITEALHVLDSQPKVGVVYGDRQDFGMRNAFIDVPPFDVDSLLACNFIDACALIRKKVWSDCGGYDSTLPLPGLEDWDFWVGVARQGWQFHHLERVAFDYRVRPDSMSSVFADDQQRARINAYVIQKHSAFYSERLAGVLVAAQRSAAQLFCVTRDYDDALRHGKLALEGQADRFRFQIENESKQHAQQIAHLQRDADERAKHIAILQREIEEKTRQVIHFKGDAEEKMKHVALLQREIEEKTGQVIHFKNDAEDKDRHVAQLEGDLDEKSRQAVFFKDDAEEKAKRILQFQEDLKTKEDTIITLQRDSDEQCHLIERLNAQLGGTEERLKRIKGQLADARWAVFTLRKRLLQQIESTEHPSARLLELESHAASTESQRDQLRTMVRALQEDVDRAEAEYRTTTERLQKTAKELRSQRKQMDRLRNGLSGKLILPFGKTQRKLQELAAVREKNV